MITSYTKVALPSLTKGEVRRAGENIKQGKKHDNFSQALNIAQQWRSLHMYPLNTFQAMLRGKLKTMEISALVAQRLKRMPTIINKLSRIQGTLETMQDIGGIRVVLPDLQTLRSFEKKLRGSRFKHERVRERDYITLPKADGYRGVHLIYRIYSGQSPKEVQGLTIELQIRTELQHFWATAVEAVDMFYGESLKIGGGDEGWREFFLAASAAFALQEKTPLPEAYQEASPEHIRKSLVKHARKMKAIASLEAMQRIAQEFRLRRGKGKQYHLLIFIQEDKKFRFQHSAYSNKEEAENTYDLLENLYAKADIVLVAANTEDLEKLYSNYLLNVDGFLQALRHAMGE